MRGNQIVRKLLGIRAKQERSGDGGHVGIVRKVSVTWEVVRMQARMRVVIQLVPK